MAVKSKAQVQTLKSSVVTLLEDAETWLSGTFTTDTNAIDGAISAGDAQPEDTAQKAALAAAILAGESLYNAVAALFRSLHPTFGRYAGSINLGSQEKNLQALHDKLITDVESTTSRGLTKFASWTPGTNEGDGAFIVRNTDVNGTSMDISRIETLTLTCAKADTETGVPTGGGEFTVEGGSKADHKWDEGGSGETLGYNQAQHGLSVNDWHRSVLKLRGGARLKSVGGASATGNFFDNGDFESALGSGATKIVGYDIVTGESALSLETTEANAAKGLQSLRANGNFNMTQDLVGKTGIRELQPYHLTGYILANANVTAGTVTLKIMSDVGIPAVETTHATVTQDTTGLTDDTWTRLTGATFLLPTSVGENLRLEVELTGYTGTDYVKFDEFVLAPLRLYAGRAMAIISGLVNWRVGDSATGVTTSTDAGTFQKALNRHHQRWVEHAGTPVGGW